MRTPLAIATLAVTALHAAGCTATRTGGPAGAELSSTAPPDTGSTEASAPPGTSPSGCAFQVSQGQPAPAGKDVGLPPPGAPDAARSVVLRTSGGDVEITLAGAKAPCTVASFAHLAGTKFYDGTPCHRLTSHERLKVLQCGDPTGTGSGGPGYTVPDENPTDLPPSPADSRFSLYARGTVAMANTGAPNSGGSQFFIVYGDSALPPTYAVFGTVSAPGLAVLDGIAAAGLTPSNGPDDGAPRNPVTIQQAIVGT